MKDLQSLIQHPNVQGSSMVVLNSGKPIVLVKGSERSALGRPLNSNQIIGLLRASLPKDVVGGFSWGKRIDSKLAVADQHHPISIQLHPDKSMHVEIALETAAYAEPQVAQPAQAADQAEALDEDVMEELVAQLTNGDRLALVYFKDFHQAGALEQALSTMGYQPRKTNEAAAVLEVLKYHDYPILIMQLDENFRRDPVLAGLAAMNMEARRSMYSLLIAPGMDVKNTALAFSLSVHQTMQPEEMGNLEAHLENGLKSWKRFTAPFHEFLEAMGRL